MKKTLLFLMLALLTSSMFGQMKGDKLFLGGATASLGTMKLSVTNGTQSVNSKQPMSTSFGLQAGLGYFVADNFMLGMGVGGYYQTDPTTKVGTQWLHNNTYTASLNPFVAYYIKITDRFYYTPEVGLSLSLGRTEMEESATQSTSYKEYGIGAYGNLCAFEVKATDKLSFGFSLASLEYQHLKMPAALNGLDVVGNQIGFYVNKMTIFCYYYF